MPTIIETIHLLSQFRDLPVGWNFGSGVPSAPTSLAQSMLVVCKAYILGLDEIEAFPGVDGEIQVNFYKDEARLEMIFEVDGTICVTFEEGEKSIRLAESASLSRVIKFLEEFEKNKCRSSVSLISSTTIARNFNALLASHSAQAVKSTGFRSSTKIAAKSIVTAFACTPSATIKAQQERPSSFGKYRAIKSRPPAKASIV